jgi:hypothetical protein
VTDLFDLAETFAFLHTKQACSPDDADHLSGLADDLEHAAEKLRILRRSADEKQFVSMRDSSARQETGVIGWPGVDKPMCQTAERSGPGEGSRGVAGILRTLMRHGYRVLPMVFLLSTFSQIAFAQLPATGAPVTADENNPPAEGSASNWMVSETTSPVDYSLQITATTFSITSLGEPQMSLAMHCRRGRTDVVVGIADFARYPAGATIMLDYVVISQEAIRKRWVERRWMQRDGVEQRWNEGNSSVEVALSGDAIGFLQLLPDDGMLFLRVSDRQRVSHYAEFHLTGLEPIRRKVATACKWPGSSSGTRK